MPDTLQIVQRDTLAALFVEYLESGKAPTGLFADEVVATIHVGGGHYEIRTPAGLERELQQYGGPIRTEVLRHESTPSGFILEFTQRSPQGDLYEELVWALVEGGRVHELRWYCTGIVPGG
jgi:hypothetical protein